MKPLRDWSGPRVATAALVWLIGLPLLTAPALFGAVGWLARAERERAAVAARDSIVPGLRVDYLQDSGDFMSSFAHPGVMLLVGLLLLPPLALCLAWIVARRRHADQPT